MPKLALTVASGHAIFLDCVHDRYFTLSPRENAAVVSLLAGQPIDDSARRAIHSALDGAIPVADLHRLLPPTMRPAAQRLAVEERSSYRDRLAALVHLGIVAVTLKMRGLAAALACAAPGRRAASARSLSLTTIVAAHDWLSRHVTAHDACLLRSLALARHARSHSCGVELVIAVKAEPFAAHCWVQAGTGLLNEEPETAAAFTPILIVA